MRSIFLLSSVLVLTAPAGFCASADFVGSSAPFTVEHTTQIPGDTIKAGSYSISVTEQIADRMIVRIDSTTSKNHAIFLGVPSSASRIAGGSTGVVAWPAGVNKTPTLRGFVFPNGNTVEFVYPKEEAAALAKENAAPVVAVDPRSEGRVALKSLSQDELQIVNLWLLSLTSTGLADKTPAILARHYDPTQDLQHPTAASAVAPIYPVGQRPAPAVEAQTTPAPVSARDARAPLVAKRTPPVVPVIAPPAPVVRQAKRAPVARPAASAPAEVATVEEPVMPEAVRTARQTPMIAQLPHTGGSLPLVWMVGLMALLGAVLARIGVIMTRRVVS